MSADRQLSVNSRLRDSSVTSSSGKGVRDSSHRNSPPQARPAASAAQASAPASRCEDPRVSSTMALP